MDSIKHTLRSIIISSPKKLSVEELTNDYYSIEGSKLPFRALGFKSNIELLQSMNDTIAMSGQSQHSIVSVVGETKSHHLIQLIANQKTNTKSKKSNISGNKNGFHKNQSYRSYKQPTNMLTNRNSSNYGSTNNNQITKPSMSKSLSNSNKNNSYKSHSNQNDTQKYNTHKGSNHTSENKYTDTPNKSLKSSDINTSKQSANGDLFTNKIITSVSNKSVDKTTNISNKPKNEDAFLKMCKNQNMLRPLKDLNEIKNNANQDQYNIKQNINNETKYTNGFESHITSANVSSLDPKCNSEKAVAHFTPKQNHSKNIESSMKSLNINQHTSIPEEIMFRIAAVLMAYCNTININNFSFVYLKCYYSIFEPKHYGFNSTIDLFKSLDQMIEVRNNMLYGNICVQIYTKQTNFNVMSNKENGVTEEDNVDHIFLNNLNISLHIDQLIVPKNTNSTTMVLVEVYNPSLFFLQLCNQTEKLNILMKQMESFYDKADTNYCVQPENILVGYCYVSYFTEYENANKWYRVRVLREVNSMLIQVIQVDYGTVDYIQKTNLKFLKKKFCNLPCQAIQCCLTNYNELNTISQDVTLEFLKLINNKPIIVKIENNLNINEQSQVLHVTLLENSSDKSQKCKNINTELTINNL